MKFKFEDLIIWQKGMGLAEELNKASEKFPKKKFLIFLLKSVELQVLLL